MDKNQDLCGSLIKWLQTFELEAPHCTAEDISDGVAMAQALGQIAPEWFSEAFLSKIKTDVGSNWRLKASNLKKILDAIIDYYQECLNQQLIDFKKPDVTQIAEHCSREELGRLLQLILGCAVNCSYKQDYITIIMGMEESVQQVIMQSIQELESGGVGLSNEDSHMQKLISDLNKAVEERDQMEQRCHELDMQVSLLQEEKVSILQENRKLQERLQEVENPQNPSLVAGNKYNLLKKEYDQLKEEMFRLETAKDDCRIRAEVQERELIELQSRIEELQLQADEARHLRDEIDVLKETADKVGKYEVTIESYKRKLEELSDLKRQLKILEEKNTNYMQNNLELEEEVKRHGTWKSQVEMYKKQVSELLQNLNEETKRADKVEFDAKKAQEKILALTRENVQLTLERDYLKEANEELKCTQLSNLPGGGLSDSPKTPLTDTGIEDMLQPDVKEKIARLMHENKMLKLKQQEPGGDQLPVVQALLDDANQQIRALTSDNRLANQRILELESQVEEIQTEKVAGGDMHVMNLRKEVVTLRAQVASLAAENERQKQKVKAQEEALEESNRKCTQLKEALTRKEERLEALEERYKKVVEKAKATVANLDAKPNAELAALKNQLLEKNNIIQKFENDEERGKVEQQAQVPTYIETRPIKDWRALVLGSRSWIDKDNRSIVDKQISSARSNNQYLSAVLGGLLNANRGSTGLTGSWDV